VLSALHPVPHIIEQTERQYLQYEFSEYAHSAYPTAKQKTKLKFPNADVQETTGKPTKEGTSYTYGPFNEIPAGGESQQSVRYEFTKPIITTTLMERDIEVSHWGGNIAFEERYWLTNRGATLKDHFKRTQWATQHYYNPPTSAIKTLSVPLKPGSTDAYFTDEIGNISTSQFRPGTAKRDGRLELKPRYPVFGGWQHPFKIGWNNDLSRFLRAVQTGESAYVLNVPFLEGPKQPEGISYEKVVVRVILPEGAL
jgi:oligosaccharyltransferase complex subunit alpha (ribophorin I)